MIFVLTGFAQLPPISPNVYRHAPLRVVGTNLYDLSPVILDWLSGRQEGVTHYVKGEFAGVSSLFPKTFVVSCPNGPVRYAYQGSPLMVYGGSRELLAGAAAASMADKDGTVSLGALLAVSPELRYHYRPVQPVEQVLVANLPGELHRTGYTIQFFAVFLGRYEPQTKTLGAKGVRYYEYGKRFSGGLENYSVLHRVTSRGIVLQSLKSKTATVGSVSNDTHSEPAQAQSETNGNSSGQESLPPPQD